jgi:hypothetical protein
MLMLILFIAAIVGIAFVFTFFDKILKVFTTRIVNSTRTFLWENKSLVDIFFIIIYAIIQLIFLFEITKPHADTNVLLTIFAIALLTVLGVERIFLRARFNFLDVQFNEAIQGYNILDIKYNSALDRERRFIGLYKRTKGKGLNIGKKSNNKKG